MILGAISDDEREWLFTAHEFWCEDTLHACTFIRPSRRSIQLIWIMTFSGGVAKSIQSPSRIRKGERGTAPPRAKSKSHAKQSSWLLEIRSTVVIILLPYIHSPTLKIIEFSPLISSGKTAPTFQIGAKLRNVLNMDWQMTANGC